MLIFTLLVQVYIVSGGFGSSFLASTETLERDGGSAWQYAASMPSARSWVRGVGLDNGRFMITGEFWTILNIIIILTPDTLQKHSVICNTAVTRQYISKIFRFSFRKRSKINTYNHTDGK